MAGEEAYRERLGPNAPAGLGAGLIVMKKLL
jgi:hypothetical protein